MANKLLKSLTFPDLSDTYVIPDDLQADIASVESSMTATKNYAVGDLIIVNGALYRAIASIASGATLTVGTNVAATTIEAELEAKADIDGNYPDMTVGNAEQLVSTVFVEDSEPYKFRTSGGSADIGDREVDELVGGTVAWNQLDRNGNFAVKQNWNYYRADYTVSNNEATITNTDGNGSIFQNISALAGHKYLVWADLKTGTCEYVRLSFGEISAGKVYSSAYENLAYIYNVDSGGSKQLEIYCYGAADTTGYAKNVVCIDLTQMFGSTIAYYIYSLEQSTPGAGVAWFRKLFPNTYYAYNAGELISVGGLTAHKMVGFNAWDEEWENGYYDIADGSAGSSAVWGRSKNPIPCVPNTTYCLTFSNQVSSAAIGYVLYYTASGDYIANTQINSSTYTGGQLITTPANAYIMKFYNNAKWFTNAGFCINLSWDGERDGEYAPYVEHTYPLDSSLTLRGVPMLDANNSLYYDGDTYESDGTVTRKYAVLDMGTLSWVVENASTGQFYINNINTINLASKPPMKFHGNLMCVKYQNNPNAAWNSVQNGQISATNSQENVILRVVDSTYANATAAAFKAAMSGVYLVYEVYTPTTETADPYHNPQIVDDFGTEEYVSSTIVPVGHNTKYANNLRAKLEMSPESPSDNGDFIVRHANGQNTYVPLLFPAAELPAAPTTDGNYRLKCTVSSGNATYTWESIS